MIGEGLLQPTHILLILGILLIFWGPQKLPLLGRGMGKGIREFKDALKGLNKDEDESESNAEASTEEAKKVEAKKEEKKEAVGAGAGKGA